MVGAKDELIRLFTKAISEENAALLGGVIFLNPLGNICWKSNIRFLATDIKLNIKRKMNFYLLHSFNYNQRMVRNALKHNDL